MLQRLRNRSQGQEGFTLIELLVVILIIGILAAIAIPSFLNQKGKANDANAKAVGRTAQTAMETYFTDNQTYLVGAGTSALEVAALRVIEPTLAAADVTTATIPHNLAVGSGATPASATLSGVPSTTDFGVSVVSGASTPVTFTIKNTNGTVTRSCAPASTGGCNAAGTW